MLTGLLILAVDNQPAVNRSAEITPADIERAKRILEKNDPRKMKAGVVRTIAVSQQDLDVAANYLANQYGNGGSRVVLTPNNIRINASVQLPINPIGSFLNVDAALTETATLPRFEYVRIGRLSVPAGIADWLLARALVKLQGDKVSIAATDVIKKVSITDARLAITYEWKPDLPDKLRAVLVPPADQERLRIYHERLTQATRLLTPQRVPLPELMLPLFRLAQERSRAGDPVAENRAALLVITFYVSGKSLTTVIPAAKNWPRPAPRAATFNGRTDFPAHFMISAALAANAGGPLSDAVGLYKEIADSRGGSGFSFTDLAADRAGTRFGERAALSAVSARKLQREVSAGASEKDLMPSTADLPEFMPEEDFKRRFGGVGSPAYNEVVSTIERRIAALPLYR
jgi:hypothetical protein